MRSRLLLVVPLVLGTALAGCGTSREKAAQELRQVLTQAEKAPRSEQTIRGWPEKFCSLSPGLGRFDVQEVMGRPTRTVRDSTHNQETWAGLDVRLTVRYDDNDRVRRLDSTGKAKIPCVARRSG
ncbi:hypothetical protein AB0L40_26740 [Patulibacter sp. NPDC049589]|uniref:hypothetical protein n=1 Tax=Patulibacter sp. NPDC049589 TaxID=3154731 RepID=UPI003421C02F